MPVLYDRTLLRTAATAVGHRRPAAVARALRLHPMTAWRLWNGRGRPGPETTAAVQAAYGIPAAALLIPDTGQAA
ncbi:XRE family transcriptional regulator [Streptomyces sp. MMS24-I29]|uniref:XRE family transcriptional regulator n=1 Tax=Streptomyces sp. MMS24-I29 TaxID=3351480 RepID=UPI003C7E98A1